MGKFWSKVKSAFKKVAAVALVVIAIVQPELIPAIGKSILTTLGVSAPSAAAATAAGSSAITTASSLAQGNPLNVALKQGATAGVTSFVGISTATATGSAAVGSAAGSAAGTVVAGGSPQDVIKNAVAGGLGAGVGDAVGSTEIGKTTGISTAAGKGVGTLVASGGDINAAINAAVTTELTSLAGMGYQKYQDAAYKATLTPEQQAIAGAQSLVDTSKAQPGTMLAQADTGTMTDAGRQLGEITVTAGRDVAAPENVLPFTTTDVTRPSTAQKTTPAGTPAAPSAPGQVPSLSEVTVTSQKEPAAPENVLPFTSTDVSGTTTPTSTTPTSNTQPLAEKPVDATAPEKIIQPSLYFTGVAPTASPLAQGLGTSFSALPTTGLTGERGAGEIESKESGKQRQNVWNEASLRLKDALGV